MEFLKGQIDVTNHIEKLIKTYHEQSSGDLKENTGKTELDKVIHVEDIVSS